MPTVIIVFLSSYLLPVFVAMCDARIQLGNRVPAALASLQLEGHDSGLGLSLLSTVLCSSSVSASVTLNDTQHTQNADLMIHS